MAVTLRTERAARRLAQRVLAPVRPGSMVHRPLAGLELDVLTELVRVAAMAGGRVRLDVVSTAESLDVSPSTVRSCVGFLSATGVVRVHTDGPSLEVEVFPRRRPRPVMPTDAPESAR
jgi:hypothetical protein